MPYNKCVLFKILRVHTTARKLSLGLENIPETFQPPIVAYDDCICPHISRPFLSCAYPWT
jgi:hypothetical protein